MADEAKLDDNNPQVFVGNVSFDTTWEALTAHMEQAGKVEFADIPLRPDGRSKGFGLVKFSTGAEAREAMATLHGSELDGRTLQVREDRSSAKGGSSALRASRGGAKRSGRVKVVVGNLGYGVKWFHIKDAFAKAAYVAYANVVAGSDDQNVGVVEFTCLSDAEAAIAMFDGKEVAGSVVTVALSDEPQEPTVSATKVFVNNLAYSVDSADLIDHFRSAGDVVSANVFTYGGRSKGCGLVEFATEAGATAAIDTLSNSVLQGRAIGVREDKGTSRAAAPRRTGEYRTVL